MAGGADNPDVSVGAEEVLIGRHGNEQVQAEEIAWLKNAISYEFVARRSPTDTFSMV